MEGIWQITLIILILGTACGLLLDRKNKVAGIMSYSALFYVAFSAIRALQGNAELLLGEAFAGKGMMGYVKAVCVVVPIIVAAAVLKKFFSDRYEALLHRVMGFFVAIQILTITLWGFTVLKVNAIEFIIAAILGFVIKGKEKENDNSYLMVIASVGVWISHFILLGPAELYAFNKHEYMFTFKDFYFYMLLFGALLLAVAFVNSKYLSDKRTNTVVSVLIWLYVIPSYIQTMFLNSGLSSMMEVDVVWSVKERVSNGAIWIVVIAILIGAGIYGKSKGVLAKIICYSSCVIIALQLLGLVSVVATKGVFGEEKPLVTMDNMYSLSDDNIVVIMLDTYGTQIVDYVQERDADFYSPLHDFTYYSNMKSMHEFTDGSVHFLLTGKMKDKYTIEDNADSTFLKDIKKYGYDIRLYTNDFLATNFGDGVVSNISNETVRLYVDKVISQMVSSGRYRSMPLVIKSYYSYSNSDFDKCVNLDNVYVWGTDADVYWKLHNNGITVDKSLGKTFSLYHLKGAHVHCYLRENMEYDNSYEDPLAQWRASMKIAYEFMDQMKASGIYDDSTIIIMADHGPNGPTRSILDTMGIFFNEDIHPIFFIKKPGETHESMIVDDTDTSHEAFHGTIMELIDESNENYGPSLWD